MKRTMLVWMMLLLPLGAHAQDNYEWGTYWDVSAVETKPGQFEAYINDINGLWRKQMDRLKADGKVVSYRIMSTVYARQGEPNLYLLVEWKSAADMLDTPMSYWDGINRELAGSRDEMRDRTIKREDIRSIMSSSLLREMSFKN